MNIDFSFLTWTKVWFEHTVSVLFDQETAGLGWWRRSPDVYWRDPDSIRSLLCWGRARSSANVTSPADEAPARGFPQPRFMNCCSHSDPGGRAVLLHIGNNLPALKKKEKLLSSEAGRLGWSTTLFESSGYATWLQWFCGGELFKEGYTRFKLLTSCTKTTVCTVNILYSKSHLTLLD